MIWVLVSSGLDRKRKSSAYIGIDSCRHANFVLDRVKVGVTSEMTADHQLGEHLILHRVDCVFHNAKDVESRQDWLGEFDILLEWDGGVVPPSNRVGCGDDGASRLERGDDAGLGDRDGLLLHSFVNGRPVRVIHLVKLVDQAVALIGEN